MGRTRKTIAIAPFLHRQCQWSGEFAAVRLLKLSLEDVTTSVRRLHPTEADVSNTDLVRVDPFFLLDHVEAAYVVCHASTNDANRLI